MPCLNYNIADVLCEQYGRKATKDNCVHFKGKILQIPGSKQYATYAKRNVIVKVYPKGYISTFYGPKCITQFDSDDKLIQTQQQEAA